MNSHKNARLSFEGRKLLIHRIAVMGLAAAAHAAGISTRTARKWLARFVTHGTAGLFDQSSRPTRTRCSVDGAMGERIEQLRRQRMPMRRIAQTVGRSTATISRWLAAGWPLWVCPASKPWTHKSPCNATSARPQASCCTLTPKSSGALP